MEPPRWSVQRRDVRETGSFQRIKEAETQPAERANAMVLQ